MSVLVKTLLPRDEERERLTVDFEDCVKEEHSVADKLSHPRHGMLYPAYAKLRDILQAIRAQCSKKYLALTTYRKSVAENHDRNAA